MAGQSTETTVKVFFKRSENRLCA